MNLNDFGHFLIQGVVYWHSWFPYDVSYWFGDFGDLLILHKCYHELHIWWFKWNIMTNTETIDCHEIWFTYLCVPQIEL